MIDQFCDWFEGTFNNKIQAFTYPSRYAYIVVQHRKVSDGWFYGEQAYFNKLKKPYRQFLLNIKEEDGKIRVSSYHIADKTAHLGFQNLDLLLKEPLTHNVGCDTIFESKDGHYVGRIEPGWNCIVMQGTQETYLENLAFLGDGWYNVEDKGFHPESKKQLWGSQHGCFLFKKV